MTTEDFLNYDKADEYTKARIDEYAKARVDSYKRILDEVDSTLTLKDIDSLIEHLKETKKRIEDEPLPF